MLGPLDNLYVFFFSPESVSEVKTFNLIMQKCSYNQMPEENVKICLCHQDYVA